MNNNTEEKKIVFYVKVVELDGCSFYVYCNNLEDLDRVRHGTLQAETYFITDVVGNIYRQHWRPYVLSSNADLVSFPILFSSVNNARAWLKQNSHKKLRSRGSLFTANPMLSSHDHVALSQVKSIDDFNEQLA